MTLRGIRIAGVVLFGIGVAGLTARAVVAQSGQTVAAQIVTADQEDPFARGAVTVKTPGVVMPKLKKSTHPKYTPEALRAKIAGDVTVEAIVGVDGRVEKARIKESLDPALDAQALRALDEWAFEPGLMNGAPARVLVEVRLTFRIH